MKSEEDYSSHKDSGRVKKKESFRDMNDQNRNIAGMTSSILNVANSDYWCRHINNSLYGS